MMNLNLNSPAWFSREHGVDDEIYWFFRDISKYFVDKDYSEIIKTVGLMPVVAPAEIVSKGLWKEHVQFDKKINLAIISKQTDYVEYLNADIEGRKTLMAENILASVKRIEKKGKFDYKQFEKDLIEFLSHDHGISLTPRSDG